MCISCLAARSQWIVYKIVSCLFFSGELSTDVGGKGGNRTDSKTDLRPLICISGDHPRVLFLFRDLFQKYKLEMNHQEHLPILWCPPGILFTSTFYFRNLSWKWIFFFNFQQQTIFWSLKTRNLKRKWHMSMILQSVSPTHLLLKWGNLSRSYDALSGSPVDQ